MRADLDDCVEAARAKYPGLPVFAHRRKHGRRGGARRRWRAIVRRTSTASSLSAPAVWSRDDMPFSYRVALWMGVHTVPWMHVSGSGLHIVASDNIEVLRKLGRDPYFQHETRVDQVYGLVNMMDAARNAPAKFCGPAAHSSAPWREGSAGPPRIRRDDTIAALGNRADVRDYPNGYHMLMRDLDREVVWKDIDDWIVQHCSAQQSGGVSKSSSPAAQ